MPRKAYDFPEYYELALSPHRHVPREVDFFEKSIARFSRVPVRAMLEVACGNSPHADEITRRGYRFIGLDRNARMLAYSERRAHALGRPIRTVRADMLEFRLTPRADFAFVLFGSIYRRSNEEFLRHLACMAQSLRRGALYLMHMVVEGNADHLEGHWESRARRGGVSVRTTYERTLVDLSRQLRRETLRLDVRRNGTQVRFEESNLDKFILPQEFLLLLPGSGFEFVAWFDGFDLRRRFDGRKGCNYVVTLLRRR